MSSNMRQQLLANQALCAVIEQLINQALAYNLTGTTALKPLAEKTLMVNLAELDFALSFSVYDEKIIVSTLDSFSNCTITTSINTLIAIKNEQQSITSLIKQDQLDIDGDIKIAQQFADIAQTLDIDWQTELAKHIGDIPTYQLQQLGKKVKKSLQFAQQQIQADFSEWLLHEKKLLISASQLQSFYLNVAQTAQQTEQLEQRIEHLLKQQQKGSCE